MSCQSLSGLRVSSQVLGPVIFFGGATERSISKSVKFLVIDHRGELSFPSKVIFVI